MGLSGTTVLVTGGSSGIGAATARALAAAGARVLVAGRNTTRLRAVAAETGGLAIEADLAAPDGPARLARAALSAVAQWDDRHGPGSAPRDAQPSNDGHAGGHGGAPPGYREHGDPPVAAANGRPPDRVAEAAGATPRGTGPARSGRDRAVPAAMLRAAANTRGGVLGLPWRAATAVRDAAAVASGPATGRAPHPPGAETYGHWPDSTVNPREHPTDAGDILAAGPPVDELWGFEVSWSTTPKPSPAGIPPPRTAPGACPAAPLSPPVHGGIDILINNAGVGWAGPLDEMNAAKVAQLVAVNLTAPIELTRLLAPTLAAGGRGRVVFISSIAGATGAPQEAVYAATKAGLNYFAESLRYELAGSGVGVSVVVPGVIDTPFFAIRGKPYTRSRPAPISAQRAARTVLAAIEREQPMVFVPRWLRFPAWLHGAAPNAFRALAARFG